MSSWKQKTKRQRVWKTCIISREINLMLRGNRCLIEHPSNLLVFRSLGVSFLANWQMRGNDDTDEKNSYKTWGNPTNKQEMAKRLSRLLSAAIREGLSKLVSEKKKKKKMGEKGTIWLYPAYRKVRLLCFGNTQPRAHQPKATPEQESWEAGVPRQEAF